MKPDKSFDDLYQNSLLPALQSLEATRMAVVSQFWRTIAWLIATGIIALVAYAAQEGAILVLAIVPFLLLCFTYAKYSTAFGKYKGAFKSEVVLKMIQYFEKDLKYLPASLIPSAEFKASDIFRDRIDTYAGSDLIEGNIGETRVRFSELFAQERRSNGKNTYMVTIFKGIFFIADFNKKFNSHTVVLPETMQGLLGRFGKTLDSLQMGRGQMVTLESPDFNKKFVVYSNNQQEARYILSPSLMEEMLKCRNESGRDIYFSFCNSNIYIAIPVVEALFEPMLFSSGLNQQYLKGYFDYINLCTGIVSELNLNTRIWTKE